MTIFQIEWASSELHSDWAETYYPEEMEWYDYGEPYEPIQSIYQKCYDSWEDK